MQKGNKGRKHSIRKKTDYYDYNLLAAVILLICFGLIMLYSTSAYEAQLKFKGDDMYYFRRQAIISAGAILGAIFMSRFDYHLLIPVSGLVFVVSLILMALVRFSPFAVTAFGSRRWLKLFGVQFQPSEIAKIAVIIYLPVVIIKMGRKVKTLNAVLLLLFLGALQGGGALFFTDNLSTGIIIGGIAVMVIFIAHPKTKPFLITGGCGLAVVGSVVAYMGATMTTSEDFRIKRILAWLHPEANMSTGGDRKSVV